MQRLLVWKLKSPLMFFYEEFFKPLGWMGVVEKLIVTDPGSLLTHSSKGVVCCPTCHWVKWSYQCLLSTNKFLSALFAPFQHVDFPHTLEGIEKRKHFICKTISTRHKALRFSAAEQREKKDGKRVPISKWWAKKQNWFEYFSMACRHEPQFGYSM